MEKREGSYQEIQQPEIIEGLVAKGKEEVRDLLGLIEMDFFGVGDRYGFEQLLPEVENWNTLNEIEREKFLKELGPFLGADLIGVSEEQVVRRYREEGVKGQPSEGGANVRVLATKFPELEIHVMEYTSPDLGIRYDLVRAR